jgi:hypothetical protein
MEFSSKTLRLLLSYSIVLDVIFSSGPSRLSAECLTNTPTGLPVETSFVADSLPGETWSVMDQCKLWLGPNATVCPVNMRFLFLS